METKDINNNSEYNEIDLTLIFSILWKRKIFITIFTGIFAVSSVFYALSLPNYYQSSLLFNVIEEEQSSFDSLASQYGGLASMAGLDIPQSSSKDKSSLIIFTIESREFLKHLLSFDDVLENIVATKNFDQSNQSIVYDEDIYNPIEKKWIRDVKYPLQKIPSYLEAHEIFMNNMINITQDRKSGFITVSIKHISPIFASELLELIVNQINQLIKDNDLNESLLAIKYLDEQSENNPSKNIKNSITSIYETQLRKQMMANIRSEYIINVIDAPFVPEKKIGPSRSIICILITLIAGVLAIIISIARYFLFEGKIGSN